MPQPPQHDGFFGVKFVTNYVLMGCAPPFWLAVEFSQEPLNDLIMLIIEPDWQDIAQAVLEPKGQRNRRSGRHGRKRKGKNGFPDTSDMIGNKVRGWINPHDALNFSPVRKIFRVWNVYEGLNFTAALLDGISAVGYKTLWGVLNVSPGHCREFARISKHFDGEQVVSDVGPFNSPFLIPEIDFNVGFSTSQYSTDTNRGDYQIAVNVTIKAGYDTEPISCRLVLSLDTGEWVGTSQVITLEPGEIAHLTATASAGNNRRCGWGLAERTGNFIILHADMLAFTEADVW